LFHCTDRRSIAIPRSVPHLLVAGHLHRRAKELGDESKKLDPPLETITQDGTTATVTSEGEIVEG